MSLTVTSRAFLLVSLVVVAICVTCLPVCGAEFVPHYTFTDLGVGVAYGINDGGQVVGQGSAGQAVRWDLGSATPTDLGTLGGSWSQANSINVGGQIVGASYTSGNAAYHAVQWGAESPTAIDLGVLGGPSIAYGINTSGQVAGTVGGNTARQAVRWDAGSTTPIYLIGDDAYAMDINDLGQVVGAASGRPVLWNVDGTRVDLATPEGSGWAFGNNDSGQVVGQIGSYQAVRWDSYGAATNLASLGGRSNAYAISNGGWAVGYADTSDGSRYASLWIGNTVYDLNALLGGTTPLTLYEARGINGSGQIVGSAIDQGGSYHAFLLTLDNQDPGPDPPPDPGAVPEPSTLALLASSLLGGVGLMRRRRKA